MKFFSNVVLSLTSVLLAPELVRGEDHSLRGGIKTSNGYESSRAHPVPLDNKTSNRYESSRTHPVPLDNKTSNGYGSSRTHPAPLDNKTGNEYKSSRTHPIPLDTKTSNEYGSSRTHPVPLDNKTGNEYGSSRTHPVPLDNKTGNEYGSSRTHPVPLDNKTGNEYGSSRTHPVPLDNKTSNGYGTSRTSPTPLDNKTGNETGSARSFPINLWNNVDIPEGWTDSVGEGCDWYAAGYGRCEMYGHNYDLARNGLVANDVCVVCGGGGPVGGTPVGDSYMVDYPEGWIDSYGDGCDWYAAGYGRCEAHGNIIGQYGTNANYACLACGGGVTVYHIDYPLYWTDIDGYGCDWWRVPVLGGPKNDKSSARVAF